VRGGRHRLRAAGQGGACAIVRGRRGGGRALRRCGAAAAAPGQTLAGVGAQNRRRRRWRCWRGWWRRLAQQRPR
jgi:hypothetical protein